MRILPNINEPLLSHITAWQRKLYTRKDVPVRGDIAKGVSGATGISVHHIFPRSRRRGTEFLHVVHQRRILKGPTNVRTGSAQVQDGSVAVHFRSDGWIERVRHAQFLS